MCGDMTCYMPHGHFIWMLRCRNPRKRRGSHKPCLTGTNFHQSLCAESPVDCHDLNKLPFFSHDIIRQALPWACQIITTYSSKNINNRNNINTSNNISNNNNKSTTKGTSATKIIAT